VPMQTRHEIPTDLITPLGAYLQLRERAAAAFLLESVERGRLGRHSFVGCGSRLCSFVEAEVSGEPVVGYLGYDFVAQLEPTVSLPAAGPDVPESRFVVPDVLIRFDHALGVADVLRGDPEAVSSIGGTAPERVPETGPSATLRFPDQATYEEGVRRAQQHIRDGDAFQIVLSQRAERPTHASAVALYRALRRVNPSPYLFLLEVDDLALIGSSPETLVKADGRRASLNPIAGTTARGPGDADRLLASEKDRAEHVMLVDLGRNDLSRVCTPGTVRVERFLEVEPYSHVTHLVSQVDGELRDGVGHFDLLRACFPAGTVSGAPKVRAMQIISELEGYRRGTYAGAVGYALPAAPLAVPPPGRAVHPRVRLNRSLDTSEVSDKPPGAALDTCIAIRTILLREGVAHMQAGAGIVADSDPGAEHAECLDKLAAVEAAIDLAEGITA
jgi:anthranilate synthase component I